MMARIVPLEEAHVSAAADLVAARYRDERAALPLVSDAYSAGADIEPRLRELVASSSGVAALRDGRLRGFLVGMPITWRAAPTTYVPEHGHGAEPAEAYALYRGMYAEAARLWVADGRRDHLITVFASDTPAFDACVSLGYGAVGIDTLRDMAPSPTASNRGVPAPDIRRATPSDVDLIAPLEIALRDHLAASPTFLPRDIEEPTHFDEAFLADTSRGLWLAFRDDEPRAFLCLVGGWGQVLPTSDPHVVSCIGAYTAPESRGSGVAAALLDRGIEWARDAGYTRCAVDFETANVPGAAFWLSKGFQPVTRSLYRHTHDTGLN
jgi:GNAT superfamily N-acetyltransferase